MEKNRPRRRRARPLLVAGAMAAASLGAGCDKAVSNPFFPQDSGNPFGDLAAPVDIGNPFGDFAQPADMAPSDGPDDGSPGDGSDGSQG